MLRQVHEIFFFGGMISTYMRAFNGSSRYPGLECPALVAPWKGGFISKLQVNFVEWGDISAWYTLQDVSLERSSINSGEFMTLKRGKSGFLR